MLSGAHQFKIIIILTVFSTLPTLLNSKAFIDSLGSYWQQFKGNVVSGDCSGQSYKLLSLLNLLCNATQTTSTEKRDACYGCFFRIGNMITGMKTTLLEASDAENQLLSALRICALDYLKSTMYEICTNELTKALSSLTTIVYGRSIGFLSGYCPVGYCEFVRCIRRINANNLVNSCFMENYPNFNLTNGVVSNRIFFITNVTACILAKSRCSLYHPISGEYKPQQQPQPGISISYYNSMQIAPNGDIKLVSYPYTTKVAELFCSNSLNGLEQAVYREFIC
ncbi:hypothetical protein ACFFRR_005616 [Megaselia abdita]